MEARRRKVSVHKSFYQKNTFQVEIILVTVCEFARYVYYLQDVLAHKIDFTENLVRNMVP